MGDWTISIRGSAPDVHKEAEADLATSAFVKGLTEAGHQVTAATFTHEPRPEALAVDKLREVQAP